MDKYKDLLYPLLDEVDGYSNKTYKDSRELPTVGYGFNLDAPETAGVLKLHGYDVHALKKGKSKLNPKDAINIRNSIVDNKANLLKSKVGEDLFNQLDDNKKAGLMSMMYNAPALIGPKMIQGLAANDNDLSLLQEVILGNNKNKDSGVLYRRLREAETMSPQNFENAFKAMEPQTLHELKMIAKDHPEISKKYAKYLSLEPEQPSILQKMMSYFK